MDPNLLPRRIVKETQRLLTEPGEASMNEHDFHFLSGHACASAPGINATPYKDNLRYFNVIMAGPSASAYESTLMLRL